MGKVPLEERQATLRHEISECVEEGYRVQHTTETTALLVKPKTFSFFWAFVWFLFLGVGILIYFAYYMSKHERTIYIAVEENGMVAVTEGRS